MGEGQAFYITATGMGWNLKREGGTKILKVFGSREEALHYAQIMIAKQSSRFRLQDRQGRWQTV